MIRQLVANLPLDAGPVDRSVDWAELGSRIRAAAERSVASPTIEEAAFDVRRRVLDSVSGPMASHRLSTIRALIGPADFDPANGNSAEAAL